MYNSIILHLYILLCIYHPKSSLLPSPSILHLPSSTSTHPAFSQLITLKLSMRFFLCLILSSFHPVPQPPSPLIADSVWFNSIQFIQSNGRASLSIIYSGDLLFQSWMINFRCINGDIFYEVFLNQNTLKDCRGTWILWNYAKY